MNALARPLDAEVVDCLKTIGLDGSLQSMDFDGLCLMEIDDFGAVAGLPWASLWPVESQHLVKASVRRAVAGKVARFSADCPTAKGAVKSWEVTVAPIRDARGEIVALQSLSHDVTRREHDRRETALVSRELSHRIKNLFAVVDSLVRLSSRAEPTARPFVEGLRQRLNGLGRAIAYIHPTHPDDIQSVPHTLQGLLASLLEPYCTAGAEIVVAGDDADISRQAVTSVALVLNELATNAVKYGALKCEGGRLTVSLTGAGEDILILWSELCAAPIVGDIQPGFGTSLLDRTVQSQLSGAIVRDWSLDGLTVRLTLPLARLADA